MWFRRFFTCFRVRFSFSEGTAGASRSAALDAMLVRRRLECKALAIVRERRADEGLSDQASLLLRGCSVSAVEGAPGHVERYWLKRVRDDVLPQSRSRATLERHAAEWGLAWPWLAERLRERGVAPTLERLQDYPETVAAYLAKRLDQSVGVSACQRAAGAINYVMSLFDLEAVANKTLPAAVKSYANLTRKRPRRQAAVHTREEVVQILEGFGSKDNNGVHEWRRWVALFVGLATCTLARWADAQFPLEGLFLPEGGTAQICMPRRKNRQVGNVFWASVPDSRTLALLKELLIERGCVIMPSGEVVAPPGMFLFPRLVHRAGSGRRGEAIWDVVPQCCKLGRNQYRVYLKLYRRALRACCNMTKTQAGLFSMHSGRRTGNNLLRRAGVPQDVRMAAGCWLDADSEQLYTELSEKERLEVFGHAAV